MSKNILIINGSPKKDGNTAKLVEWYVEGVRHACENIEIVHAGLPKFRAKGCTSCRMCQKMPDYECVICDDVKETLKKMATVDVIVFATPLYFYGPTAQLKCVIDRMFSLYKWDNTTDTFETPMRGKSMVLLLSAYEDTGLDIVEKSFKLIADYSYMKFQSFLVPNAKESMGIDKLRGIHAKAVDFGRRSIDS